MPFLVDKGAGVSLLSGRVRDKAGLNIKLLATICDRACENRACGLKYTMSFDETYLNIEI